MVGARGVSPRQVWQRAARVPNIAQLQRGGAGGQAGAAAIDLDDRLPCGPLASGRHVARSRAARAQRVDAGSCSAQHIAAAAQRTMGTRQRGGGAASAGGSPPPLPPAGASAHLCATSESSAATSGCSRRAAWKRSAGRDTISQYERAVAVKVARQRAPASSSMCTSRGTSALGLGGGSSATSARQSPAPSVSSERKSHVMSTKPLLRKYAAVIRWPSWTMTWPVGGAGSCAGP